MNKKGFLRIIEASISIILILGALLIFLGTNRVSQPPPDLSEIARDVLEEASRDTGLRGKILDGDKEALTAFARSKIRGSLNIETNICPVDEVCSMNAVVDGDIYSGERIFGATLENDASKKAKIFIWQ